MRNSWRNLFRRLAAGCVVSGSLAWSAAICYAQNSYDDASDPAYADGWQAGDDGGTGFTPWNFDSAYFWPGDGNWYPYATSDFHAIDDGSQNGTHYSNPHNHIGRSWALGSAPPDSNPNTKEGPPRAGRGFSPLQIGDTLNVVFDNPTRRQFFKGYFIRLNGGTGGVNGNICQKDPAPCTPMAPTPARKMYLSRFEYLDDGNWTIVDTGDPDYVATTLFDTDTAAAGALFSVTRTGDDTYDVLLDPLGAGPSYSTSRTFANPGVPVDWIEFTFFNPVTDLTPTLAEPATDLYIKSIEIIRAAPPGQPGDYNDDGKVDAADYVAWRKIPADFGGDPGGYNTWRENFGEGVAGGSGAVPEPSTFVSLIVAMAGLFLANFRRLH